MLVSWWWRIWTWLHVIRTVPKQELSHFLFLFILLLFQFRSFLAVSYRNFEWAIFVLVRF